MRNRCRQILITFDFDLKNYFRIVLFLTITRKLPLIFIYFYFSSLYKYDKSEHFDLNR